MSPSRGGGGQNIFSKYVGVKINSQNIDGILAKMFIIYQKSAITIKYWPNNVIIAPPPSCWHLHIFLVVGGWVKKKIHQIKLVYWGKMS